LSREIIQAVDESVLARHEFAGRIKRIRSLNSLEREDLVKISKLEMRVIIDIEHAVEGHSRRQYMAIIRAFLTHKFISKKESDQLGETVNKFCCSYRSRIKVHLSSIDIRRRRFIRPGRWMRLC